MSEPNANTKTDHPTTDSSNSTPDGTLSSVLAQVQTLCTEVLTFTVSCVSMANQTRSLITTLEESLDEVENTLGRFSVFFNNLREQLDARNKEV
jgi:hypothetical protein